MGKSNKLIAYELSMCESTVKVHIRQIMKKLNVSNRTQVVVATRPPYFSGDAVADELQLTGPGNGPAENGSFQYPPQPLRPVHAANGGLPRKKGGFDRNVDHD
jgi:hypothetical protein